MGPNGHLAVIGRGDRNDKWQWMIWIEMDLINFYSDHVIDHSPVLKRENFHLS